MRRIYSAGEKSMDNIKIGKFISEIRKERGLTQEEFASAIGVSQKTVSRWETGRNMPDYSILSSICDTLEISITELLNGKKIDLPVVPDYNYYGPTEISKNEWDMIGKAVQNEDDETKKLYQEATLWLDMIFQKYDCFTILGI